MIIPYVISFAQTNKDKPYLEQEFGAIEEENMNYFFLIKASEFIYNNTALSELDIKYKTPKDIDDFLDRIESFEMANAPWEAHIFKNEEWINVRPCSEDILEHFMFIKREQEEADRKLLEQSNENRKMIEHLYEQHEKMSKTTPFERTKKEKRDISSELNEDERETLLKISEFFDRMLKQSPLSAAQISSLEKMSELEKFSTLLTIFITQENYEHNKELFKKFLTLLVKFMNKDVQIIAEKMKAKENIPV